MLIPAALAATLLVTSCAGGSGGDGKTDASGEKCAPAGSASESVDITGDFGSDLEMTGKTPIESSELERSVLIDGEGDRSPDEGVGVTAALSFFNGRTGELIEHSPAGQPIVNSKESLAPFAYEAVRCAVEGQRVAVTLPAEDAMAGAQTMPEGLEEGDSVVLVVDVEAVDPGFIENEKDLLSKAEGETQDPPKGLPTVELAEDGAPTITIPKGTEAPKELQVDTLIEGDGEEVEPGDRAYVNYRGVIWRTGEEFDSSWSRGEPANFITTQVIGGFTQALEGQKVGSQVMAVVPADQEQGGYGADTLQQQGHEADDVMVFVLDIVGVVHAD